MLPAIEEAGALVDPSYLRVFWRACVTGPETIERNRQYQIDRAARAQEEARSSARAAG